MEGLLTTRCHQNFDHRERLRGEHAQRESKVLLDAVGSLGVRGRVVDAGGNVHRVAIELDAVPEKMLGLYCDCAEFERGENCQHAWAAMRQLENGYELDLPSGKRSEYEIYECEPQAVQLGQPLQRVKLASQSVEKEGGTKKIGRSPTAVKPRGAWYPTLLAAHRFARAKNHIAPPTNALGPLLETRTWFVLSLPDTAEGQPFDLRLYQSKIKQDGNFSIPTKVSMSKSEMQQLRNADEIRALSFLDWDTVDYGDYRQRDFRSHLRFQSHVLPEALQALCATGRFVWTMEDSRSLTEYRMLQADVEPVWQLILQIKPAAKANQLEIVPMLRRVSSDARESELRGLETVVAVCESGALLFEESVGIIRPGDVGWLQGWRSQSTLRIPRADQAEFLKTLFSFANPPELDIDKQLSVARSQGQPRGKLKLSAARHSDDYLQATVFFQYDDVELPVTDPRETLWLSEKECIQQRDRTAEKQLLEQLSGFPFSEVRFRYDESELRIHRKWFAELIHRLSEKDWEVLAEGKTYRRAGDFNIKVSSGEDWFDLQADVDYGGVKAALPTLLQALGRGERFLRLDDGTHGILPEEWLQRFAGLSQMGQLEGDAVRFGRNQALLLDMLLAEQPDVTCDRSFIACCRKLKKFSGIKPGKQPRGFHGELRGYQREGLGWFHFLKDFEFGGCLADDMGLGKTIQVLALLESRRVRRLKENEMRQPSIAIVPKSLVFNWIEEAEKFTPKLRVLDYTGLDRHQRLPQCDQCDLLVTTYATFRRDIENFKDKEFDYAILDEAQAIKNPQSQASKAVRLLKAKHRLAVTGTPVENHLGDLWSLFDFLNPGMLGSSTASRYSLASESDNGQLQVLSNALRPFILRRTKEQVLTELPPKSEQTLYCDMPPKQKKLYDELRDHYRVSLKSKVKELGLQRSKIHVLEALLRLRQVACDPRLVDPGQKVCGAKITLLLEQLSDVVAEGHKVLVFSQFTSLLALVKKEIEAKGWKYEYLDGKTSRRAAHVKRFQEESDCSLFLISLKAGGHGLNLTAAEYVYILDPWWNPAVEAQAIDRAHRMGQQKPVMAYRMIARGTVEDKIVALQQSKRQLAEAIITADKSLLRQLSAEDLQVLFE